MMKKGFLFAGLLASFVVMGCNSNSTAPDQEQLDPLSENEQMQLIATEVSQQYGGAMTDLSMAAATASGSFGAAPKTAGFDTTMTKSWITYSLSLAFYSESGAEQPRYWHGLTDSVVYVSSLRGSHSADNDAFSIDLQSNSGLIADKILSGKIYLNGTGTNNSSYALAGATRSLEVQAASSYRIRDVVFDLHGNTVVPVSGELIGTLKGSYSKQGGRLDLEDEYEFVFTITFDGDQTVTVTLPSGKSYTLHLLTGVYQE